VFAGRCSDYEKEIQIDSRLTIGHRHSIVIARLNDNLRVPSR